MSNGISCALLTAGAVSVLMTWVVSSRVGTAQAAWNNRVQKRVAVTASVLNNMKAVKMLGLSHIVEETVKGLRGIELQTSEKFRSLLIWQIVLGEKPCCKELVYGPYR